MVQLGRVWPNSAPTLPKSADGQLRANRIRFLSTLFTVCPKSPDFGPSSAKFGEVAAKGGLLLLRRTGGHLSCVTQLLSHLIVWGACRSTAGPSRPMPVASSPRQWFRSQLRVARVLGRRSPLCHTPSPARAFGREYAGLATSESVRAGRISSLVASLVGILKARFAKTNTAGCFLVRIRVLFLTGFLALIACSECVPQLHSPSACRMPPP